MKDRGIEWIGEIPEDWKIVKLKNLISFINGFAFNSETFVNNGLYSAIRIGDIYNSKVDFENAAKFNFENERLKSFIIRKNDILIAMSGATVGKLGYVDIEPPVAFVNQRVGIVRAKNHKFIFYSMNTDVFLQYIYLLSAGSAQPNISTENINEYKIAVPSFAIQQKIADFLDRKVSEIDNIIEKTKESIEEYKKYKQSLITETVTKGLNKDAEMKDSGIEWIGEIPKHWEVCRLKHLFSFKTGLIVTKSELRKTGINCINYGDIHSKYSFDLDLERDNLPKVDAIFKIQKPNAMVNNDDFVFCDTSEDLIGSGNFTFIRNNDGKEIFAGSHTVTAKPKQNFSSVYMAYLMKSKGVKCQIEQNVVGIKVFSITQSILKDVDIFMPPIGEQKYIAYFLDQKCNEIDNLITQKEQLLSELESYKKSLIYECVTGKREVD